MEKNTKSKKTLQYIIISVLFILIIVVTVFIFVMKGKNSEGKENETTTEYVETFDDFITKGDAFFGEKAYDKAAEEYLKAYDLEKDNTDVMLKLYDTYELLGNKGSCLSFLYYILDSTNGIEELTDVRKNAYTDLLNMYIDMNDNDAAYRLIVMAQEEYAGIFGEMLEEKVKVPAVNPYPAEDRYVYFGSYPQDEIAVDELPDYVKSIEYDDNGTATVYGRKYAQAGERYFSYSPIKWEILVDKDDNYILMTDKLLDCEPFMETMVDSSWDVSHLRTWLNTVYSGIAFSSEQHALIQKTLVTRPENYFYSTFNGEDSEDYVVLLSCRSLVNSQYGLRDEEQDRRAVYATDYAIARGLFADEEGRGKWWTSSNGSNNKSYVFVNYDGVISAGGELATNSKIGVRPVITVNK